MKVGTKSLLFGVHQFAWHPFTVFLAWRELYGMPTWREVVCIIIHDWGYWGCSEMDGEEGSMHPYFGAYFARELFGEKYYYFCLLHSRTLSRDLRKEPSQLCWADKFSMLYDPRWFYLLRARLTGEIHEYRQHAHDRGFIGLDQSHAAWHRKLTKHLAKLVKDQAKELA